MALVMLPCDLPWWPTVQKHLASIAMATTATQLTESMLKVHHMCNIGLDPDDDGQDPTIFDGLESFLTSDLSDDERSHLLGHTLPAMTRIASRLKQLKPAAGFHFSLQQQADHVEYDRSFVASLLANAFFSTFPKRTEKTHPTLQDFNFTYFYRHLDNNWQKAKLRSILHYFDLFEANAEPQGKVTFTRKVMSSKEWLTIDDWLECALPLCSLSIKHEGRLDRAEGTAMRICFASSRVGGAVLGDGNSQECVQFFCQPELLAVLPAVEALEDNEVLLVEGVQQVSRIADPRHKAAFEPVQHPPLVNVCCMDAERYVKLPLAQHEEDNVLRELNKALLGFRQHQLAPAHPPTPNTRRLTPIGESFNSTPEVERLQVTEPTPEKELPPPSAPAPAPCAAPRGTEWLSPTSRRGRFIVLGSSGERLPVSRHPPPPAPAAPTAPSPHFSSCHSEEEEGEEEEFLSAKTSQDGDETDHHEGSARKYSAQLDTPERRSTFAERLRDALNRETLSCSSSTDSSYAVGISVAGSDLADPNIRVKRGGSRGFMLQEESIDDQFLRESLQQEREWIDKFRSKRPGALSKAQSSKYSFSTEYSSELEELYDQFSRWLQDDAAGPADSTGGRDAQELDARDLAVVKFAGSLLKRTLSESFAGVSLSEVPAPRGEDESERGGRSRVAVAVRSLSLELARHKHKLAAQLVSMLVSKDKGRGVAEAGGLQAVATGNWGCGSTHQGDPQLKLIVQWLAASVAGVPTLYYYTCGHHTLHKLDTVCRVLLDRQWTVGELVNAAVRYSQATLNDPSPRRGNNSLFDDLIGTEKATIQRLDSQ